MQALQDFLAMGGYAAYVWPAYGVTAVVMLALLIGSLRTLKDRKRRLATLERSMGTTTRQERRAARTADDDGDDEMTKAGDRTA